MNVIVATSPNHHQFLKAITIAKPSDRIVYHRGPTCANSPLRLWARGAYEAGLVILVKVRVQATTDFDHVAVRTSKKFKVFKKATEEPKA